MVSSPVLLMVWAACGASTVFFAGSPASVSREWTDASGTNRALATLLRVEGEQLWLRRSDGRLTTTTLTNLSEGDRHYVASRVPATTATTADSSSASGPAAVLENAAGYVESMQQLSKWLGPSQAEAEKAADRALVPAALVYVRVSRAFLEDYVERSVKRQKPVRDSVLGTRIVGESETHGKTVLTLLPSKDRLSARIDFHGTLQARTRGYNGPVVLNNISDTTFRASKLVTMDDGGLRVSPSTIVAPTRLRTTSIDTHLPGLRGRIARRIAWQRTNESHGRAEAITEDHTADDIRSDFDARIDRSMAKAQKMFGEKIAHLETGTNPMRTDVRFRCRPDYLEMAIVREDATAEERKLRPPVVLETADVSVRVHRTLFTSAIEDPKLVEDLTPLFTKLLAARNGPSGGAGDVGGAQLAEDADTKLAVDLEWLSLDFMDSAR